MHQETSEEALKEYMPNMVADRDIVLRIIKDHPDGGVNDRMISEISGLNINIVTARRN